MTTPTYDTHCPVCREAITVWLNPDDHTRSGYYVIGCCGNGCLMDDLETWLEWVETLEDRSPAWWETELDRQQMRRNVATGIQPALPL